MSASTAARRSGIASSARGFRRATTTPTSRSSRCGATACSTASRRSTTTSKTRRTARCRTSSWSIRVSSGPDRSDNHPHGDIRMAQRFLHAVFGTFAALAAVAPRPVRRHVRRVGRVLRPCPAAGRRRRPRERRRCRELRADGFPGADGARVAVRARGLRGLDAVRPHVDPALPRVAVPRRAARGRRRDERPLVPDEARSRRAQPRQLTRHDRRSRARLRARRPDSGAVERVPRRRGPAASRTSWAPPTCHRATASTTWSPRSSGLRSNGRGSLRDMTPAAPTPDARTPDADSASSASSCPRSRRSLQGTRPVRSFPSSSTERWRSSRVSHRSS